jgi:hypothetical protein
MSQVDELFRTIESHDFSAIVNLASDFRTFLRILAAEKPVQDLAQQMRDPGGCEAVSQRILALAKDQGEEGLEHPWDSALAAYLWILANHGTQRAKVVAATISETPRCWWAAKVAAQVLSAEPVRSPAGNGA